MPIITLVVSLTTLIAEALVILCVGYSILNPHRRIWPPRQTAPITHYLMPVLFVATALGIVLLGILDWNSCIIPAFVRWGLGAPLWVIGNSLGIRSITALGDATTWGGSAGMIDTGPYRWSRNPQYVSFIVALLGWTLLANSLRTAICAGIAMIPLILVPFAEEPWLTEQYGEAYEAYCQRVPRYLRISRKQ